MRQISDKIEFVAGSAGQMAAMPALPALRVFDERAVGFLNALAGELLKSAAAKKYPDAVTFAFWCRKANLLSLQKRYAEDGGDRLGRGTVFHIAPGNVPANFAYSLAAGLLAGDANIVRLPSKKFAAAELICAAIRRLLAKSEHAAVAGRLCLIRFERDAAITGAISALCAARVIWGGDAAIGAIRQTPLPPRASEITFPDRYSICLIDAGKYLADCDRAEIARAFYNDTYLTDQNACTSPRLVVWFGAGRERAKEVFWGALSERLGGYELQAAQTVNKLSALYRFAAGGDCKLTAGAGLKLMRVAVKKLDQAVLANLENSGYFYEYDAESLDEIAPVCGEKCQTLSYIGFEAESLREFVLTRAPAGIDRIAPVGKTMDFSLVWDGHDLIRELSREIGVSIR
ncbi:MAG: hypothetical protein LBH21_00305 [Gracilibacteraceae bacterium]|jgi:hypothetical protein|nr:hypothetical protein [Gracilibacteraceae bacterium]